MGGIGMGDLIGAHHRQARAFGQAALRFMHEMLAQMGLGKTAERADP